MNRCNRLWDRITLHGGYHLAGIVGPNNSSLHFFYLRGRTLIVQEFTHDGSVDLYSNAPTLRMEDLECLIDQIAQSQAAASTP